jgi:hypothetical protein
MDTKRFARFSRPGHAVTGDRNTTSAEKRERVGYEIAHSIVDDHSRLAYTELRRDEKADTVVAFLARALQFYTAHGITASRVQTDNAWTYTHNRALAELLARNGITHRTIPPRTPKRNGKVERNQQTLKREWGLDQRHRSSARATALTHWLSHYNTTRNHSDIGNRPPITRVRNWPRQNTQLVDLARNRFAASATSRLRAENAAIKRPLTPAISSSGLRSRGPPTPDTHGSPALQRKRSGRTRRSPAPPGKPAWQR